MTALVLAGTVLAVVHVYTITMVQAFIAAIADSCGIQKRIRRCRRPSSGQNGSAFARAP